MLPEKTAERPGRLIGQLGFGLGLEGGGASLDLKWV